MPRTKGAKDITKRKKARILALRNVQELTSTQIAAKEGVCRNSVIAIRQSTVPPDVLAMAEQYQRQFLAYSDATAMKAAQRTFDSIDQLPADKAATVSEKFFNIGRTIRAESTPTSKKIELVVKFINNCFSEIEQKAAADPNEQFYFTRSDVINTFCLKCDVSPELVAPLVRECLLLED